MTGQGGIVSRGRCDLRAGHRARYLDLVAAPPAPSVAVQSLTRKECEVLTFISTGVRITSALSGRPHGITG
jgi:hypothetical protein